MSPYEIEAADTAPSAVLSRDCPQCSSKYTDAISLQHGSEEWPMVRCRGCDFIYLTRAPRYEELSTNLAWEKTSIIEDERRLQDRPVSKRFSRATRWRMKILPRRKMPELLLSENAPAGIVVDLGCGDGGMMHGLDDKFTPGGVEISAELAQRANENFKKRGGSCVHAPSVTGLRQIEANTVAAVTLRSYLEHELDPLGVLHEIKRVLRSDGIVLIKVPNYGSWNRMVTGRKWCGIRLPDHLNYFTPRSLKDMATVAGFKTRHGLTWALPTSDNMWAVLRHA